MCVFVCLISGLGLVVFVIVPVYGNTAMVGDGPWHSCHSCDDAC